MTSVTFGQRVQQFWPENKGVKMIVFQYELLSDMTSLPSVVLRLLKSVSHVDIGRF